MRESGQRKQARKKNSKRTGHETSIRESSGETVAAFLYMRISQLPIFRYGIALAFVALALALSLLLRPFLRDAFLIFFLSAAMLAGWVGRTGPGLLAAAV